MGPFCLQGADSVASGATTEAAKTHYGDNPKRKLTYAAVPLLPCKVDVGQVENSVKFRYGESPLRPIGGPGQHATDRTSFISITNLTEFLTGVMLSPHLREVRMEARSEEFTIAFLRMAHDIPVLRENGIAIWQAPSTVRWIRFCLLVLAGIGAFTLSDVSARAFQQSKQIAIRIFIDSDCEMNGVGGALESADV